MVPTDQRNPWNLILFHVDQILDPFHPAPVTWNMHPVYMDETWWKWQGGWQFKIDCNCLGGLSFLVVASVVLCYRAIVLMVSIIEKVKKTLCWKYDLYRLFFKSHCLSCSTSYERTWMNLVSRTAALISRRALHRPRIRAREASRDRHRGYYWKGLSSSIRKGL